MEKNNFTDFSNLSKTVESFNEHKELISAILMLQKEGKPTNLRDISVTERGIYTILPEGVIKKVALYISEKNQLAMKKENYTDPESHIFLCDTVKTYMYLQSTAAKKDQNKYKICRRKDRKFYFQIMHRDFQNVVHKKIPNKELPFCPHCLVIYNELTQKGVNREEFDIKNFFEEEDLQQGKSFIYSYDAVPAIYENSWEHLANLAKIQNNFVCEKCSVDLKRSTVQKFLHPHYQSKNFKHRRVDMLKTLCIRCHAEEEGHSEIKKTADYKEYEGMFANRG